MSLLPPNPIVASKCYYYLKKNLDPDFFAEVVKRMPPFPKFRLRCLFRSFESVDTIEFSDAEIIDFISQTEDYSKVNLWDCSDIALNMFTRMKKPAVEALSGKIGVVSFYIQSSDDPELEKSTDSAGASRWSDIYLDENILRK